MSPTYLNTCTVNVSLGVADAHVHICILVCCPIGPSRRYTSVQIVS